MGKTHSAINILHPYSHAGILAQARRIVRLPPIAQINAIAMLAVPLWPLGRYSTRIVTHWGMQDMKHPQMNRRATKVLKVGENAVIIPKTISKTDDTINDLRLPYESEIAPQIGEDIAIDTNTIVVKNAN